MPCQRGQPYGVHPTPGFIRVRKTVELPAVLVDGKLIAESEPSMEEKFEEP